MKVNIRILPQGLWSRGLPMSKMLLTALLAPRTAHSRVRRKIGIDLCDAVHTSQRLLRQAPPRLHRPRRDFLQRSASSSSRQDCAG